MTVSLVLQIMAFCCFVYVAIAPFPEPTKALKCAQFIGAGLACLTAAILLGAGLFR